MKFEETTVGAAPAALDVAQGERHRRTTNREATEADFGPLRFLEPFERMTIVQKFSRRHDWE